MTLNNKVFWWCILAAIFAFNVFDGIATLRALRHVGVYEANPIMAYVLTEWGSAAFLCVFKTFIPLVATLSLAGTLHRGSKNLKIFAIVVFFVYFLTTLWHIYLMAINYGA